MNKAKIFVIGYVVTFILLFFYSFTQVDLSLTLSQSSLYQTVEKNFQHIGYFERPLATELYVGLLILLFGFYFAALILVKKKVLSRKQVWTIIFAGAIILAFSYNAFSYDLFNYIFDAKIITHYHQNPYQHYAIQYTGDPMLSFMHWTGRTYPYGPLWLVLTVPISFIGQNIFLLTFFLFKILMSCSFLLTAYFLEKILILQKKQFALFNLAFFALNPLTIIEALVSAHNDIVMIFFAIAGLYCVIRKKWLLAVMFTIMSALVKQATIFLPLLLFIFLLVKNKKQISFEQLVFADAIIMSIGFLFYVYLGSFIPWVHLPVNEIQPWYFLWILPFIALLRPKVIITSLAIGISLGMLLRYVPFFWQGDWNGLAIPVRFYLLVVTTLVSLGIGFLLKTIKPKFNLY